jgi:D-gamma-glutamyl-meso-diaminopimelic acid endopeptidase CwlS
MKKIFCAVLILLLFIVPHTANASGNEALYGMDFWYNNNFIMESGAIVNRDGKVMLPVKILADAMGAVSRFDRDRLTYTVTRGDTELVFNLNDNTVKVNGKYVWANAPTKIIGQSVYVPATFAADKLGMKVYINYEKNRYEVYPPGNAGAVRVKVQSGDTLSKLATRYGVSVNWLMNQNGLSSHLIYPGQLLTVGYHNDTFSYDAYVSKSATLEAGPGFSYQDKGYLAAWTPITVLGKNGDWYKVSSPKGIGYIHKSVFWTDLSNQGFADNGNLFSGEIGYSTLGDYTTYKSYTVKSGDTIWSVATQHGISEDDLRKANGIQSGYLDIGQVIKIPVRKIAKKYVPSWKYGEVLDWKEQGQYVFPLNKTGVLIDMNTGVRIQVKRTTGSSHADTETLTMADTQKLKDAFGGKWSWERKPFILEVDGRRFAVSVSAMPHAGVDGAPYLANVSGRSGDYGYGPNYDAIPGNGMDGHFDIYFLNGRRHKDGQIDPQHQMGVLLAGGLQ